MQLATAIAEYISPSLHHVNCKELTDGIRQDMFRSYGTLLLWVFFAVERWARGGGLCPSGAGKGLVGGCTTAPRLALHRRVAE